MMLAALYSLCVAFPRQFSPPALTRLIFASLVLRVNTSIQAVPTSLPCPYP